MSSFPQFRRSRLAAAQVSGSAADREVIVLREALANCRSLARRWRRLLAAAAVAVPLALGFALIDRQETPRDSLTGLAAWLGAMPTPQSADAAHAAYRDNDYATALRLSLPLAEQGDARAQSLLGLLYLGGRGVPADETEAGKWFRRAAQQGDATAQLQLGIMYATGRGVPQNFDEGVNWYRLAAAGGNPQAQFNLGVMFYKGKGVAQSNVEAHMWFNLAAASFPPSERKSREQAARVRDVVAMGMTPEEISEAQRKAREWKSR